MPDVPLDLAEIEERIAAVRENLTELTEQAAAYSGAAVEELTAQRIADQEAQLERLTRQREELIQRKPPAAAKRLLRKRNFVCTRTPLIFDSRLILRLRGRGG